MFQVHDPVILTYCAKPHQACHPNWQVWISCVGIPSSSPVVGDAILALPSFSAECVASHVSIVTVLSVMCRGCLELKTQALLFLYPDF